MADILLIRSYFWKEMVLYDKLKYIPLKKSPKFGLNIEYYQLVTRKFYFIVGCMHTVFLGSIMKRKLMLINMDKDCVGKWICVDNITSKYLRILKAWCSVCVVDVQFGETFVWNIFGAILMRNVCVLHQCELFVWNICVKHLWFQWLK